MRPQRREHLRSLATEVTGVYGLPVQAFGHRVCSHSMICSWLATRSVSKEKVVTSRRVSTTRKFSNFPWARENAGRTRSSPRPPSVPCRRRDRARSGRCYSIDADAFIATTFSAQQRRLFGIVRDDATASTQTRSWQRHSPRSSVAFSALSETMLQHRRRRVHCNDILRAAASPFWHCQSATWIRRCTRR